MSYSQLFYWLVVADNARTFFTVFMIIFTAIAAISTIWFIVDRNGDDLSVGSQNAAERAKKWMWWSYPFCMLFWALYILTPSKKDALLIVAGGQTMEFLTTDKSAKEIPHELSAFLVTEIKNMAAEAKVDLNIKDQKEKILESAKSMTAKELMEKMKTDSTFAKVVLDKE
jgi:hypothetical protein